MLCILWRTGGSIGDGERGEGFQADLRKALSLPHHKAPS